MTAPMLRLAALLMLALGPGATLAQAEPPPAAAAAPQVEVALVRATRGEARIDAGLEGFARDLKSLPFQRFERVDSATWKSAVGKAGEATLAGVKVQATVAGVTADGCDVTLVVWQAGKEVAHTTVQRPWGRAHVVSVGRDGDATLVLPVRVVR